MKLKQIVSICCMAAPLLLAALAPVSADELKPADELLRLARQFEASDLSDAKEVYKALIDTYPKSREAATARQRLAAADKAEKQKQAAEVKKQAAEAKAKALQEYREAFKNARSSDELDTFIKTYTGKDPGKLIPKARQMKAAAEKRERQERAESERRNREYERNAEARRQKRQNWETRWVTDWSSDGRQRSFAIRCGDGTTEHISQFSFNRYQPYWASSQGFRTLEEAARYICR